MFCIGNRSDASHLRFGSVFSIDNSKSSSKADLNPNRLTAQKRVVENIVRGRLQLNPQNSVGHLSMAGNINDNIASFNAGADDFAKKLSLSRINAGVGAECE